MNQGELIFEDDFLFHVISQWKCPQSMLFQVHRELTPFHFMKQPKLDIKSFLHLVYVIS